MAQLASRFLLSFLLSQIATGNDFFSGVRSVLGLDSGVFEDFHAPVVNLSESPNISSKRYKLEMDQAYLNVTSLNAIRRFFIVYGISENCYKCPLVKLPHVAVDGDGQGFVIDTRWPFKFSVETAESNNSCSKTFHFGEGGHYTFKVEYCDDKKNFECSIVVDVHSKSSFIPILVAAFVLLGLALIVIAFKRLRRGYLKSITGNHSVYSNGRLDSDLGTASQTDSVTASQPAKKRLRSLDAFRGLSLVIMIFVNFGGGGYWFFQHSLWNGITVADLVFPWFIFIMGVSLALSFRSLTQANVRKITILWKIVRRTLILFALGLLLNKGTDLNFYRIPGVLQRFAFSYFVVATLELFLNYRVENFSQNVWWFSIREVAQLWMQWIFMFCFLAIYLILTYAVEVPGCGRGYVGPGGISQNGTYMNCTGGMAGYLDRKLFGENHIYGHPTCKEMYMSTMPYDPEGALGSITSAFLTFLGLQAGKIIVTHSGHIERERRMISWALLLGFLATGLCGASKNDGLIPLNKNLWSLSFILATAAMGYALLAFCYFTIDDKRWWDGSPFIFPGMNSILIYCGHEVLHSFFPFNWELHPVTHSKKLAMNIWGVSAWVIIAYYCYKIDFFVKI